MTGYTISNHSVTARPLSRPREPLAPKYQFIFTLYLK